MAGYDARNQSFQTRLIGTALGQDQIGVFVPSSIISQDKIRVGTVFITTIDLIKLISHTHEVDFRRGMEFLKAMEQYGMIKVHKPPFFPPCKLPPDIVCMESIENVSGNDVIVPSLTTIWR